MWKLKLNCGGQIEPQINTIPIKDGDVADPRDRQLNPLEALTRCGEAESCLVICRYHIRQSTTAVSWRHLWARMWIYYYSFVK